MREAFAAVAALKGLLAAVDPDMLLTYSNRIGRRQRGLFQTRTQPAGQFKKAATRAEVKAAGLRVALILGSPK